MEYGLLTFNDYWHSGKEGEVIYKNDMGKIELYGTSIKHIDRVVGQLTESSPNTKSKIVDPKFGVEYVMSRAYDLDGDYSSNNTFTEKDFESRKQKLKTSKTINIIAKRNVNNNDD